MIKGSSALTLEPLHLLPYVVAGQDLNLRPLGYEYFNRGVLGVVAILTTPAIEMTETLVV
jgi:hypothetical protein